MDKKKAVKLFLLGLPEESIGKILRVPERMVRDWVSGAIAPREKEPEPVEAYPEDTIEELKDMRKALMECYRRGRYIDG